MTSPIRFRRFIVTHDSGALELFLAGHDLRYFEECKSELEKRDYLAHLAWRKLWDSDAKRMLKKLCDEIGVDWVKQQFSDNIRIQEIEV